MAAAPQSGTMNFVGVSGAIYQKDVYISDVLAANIRFDSGGGASAASLEFWKAPENVTLIDFSIPTGLTDTTLARMTVNGRPLESVVRWANHLNTLPTRLALGTRFQGGANIGFIQG